MRGRKALINKGLVSARAAIDATLGCVQAPELLQQICSAGVLPGLHLDTPLAAVDPTHTQPQLSAEFLGNKWLLEERGTCGRRAGPDVRRSFPVPRPKTSQCHSVCSEEGKAKALESTANHSCGGEVVAKRERAYQVFDADLLGLDDGPHLVLLRSLLVAAVKRIEVSVAREGLGDGPPRR